MPPPTRVTSAPCAAFFASEDGCVLAPLTVCLDGATRAPGSIIGVCVVAAYVLDWYQSRHPWSWGSALLLATFTILFTLNFEMY